MSTKKSNYAVLRKLVKIDNKAAMSFFKEKQVKGKVILHWNIVKVNWNKNVNCYILGLISTQNLTPTKTEKCYFYFKMAREHIH